jgi:MFS family permease
MTLEMAVIAFVPLGNSTLIFWAWVINRVLSGAAEASASGADEALAYDSLPHAEQKTAWPRILSRLMSLSSIGFVAAMLIGSAVYDPDLINRALGWFGIEASLDKETVIRFPVYLTLVNALAAVLVTLSMKEPPQETECGGEASMWSGILAAGKWIIGTPFVFAIILAALTHDCVVRLFLTASSEYYRLIGIPVGWFGVIGAAFSALGIFTPKLAEWLVAHRSIRTNYLIVSAATFIGLVITALALPVWGGLSVMIFFGISFGLLNFFTSHYLNAEVDSRHRATVLSFKGLALNAGFGVISALFGGILRLIRDGADAPDAGAGIGAGAGPAFRESLFWLPGMFVLMFAGLLVYYFARVRNRDAQTLEAHS